MFATSIALAALLLLAPPESPSRDGARRIESLVDGKRFEPIATVGALPQPVKDELARLMKQDALSMADTGQPFQATDVIGPDRTLPGRRLILAGRAGDLVAVHYERGGYAHTYSVVLFRLGDAGAEVVAATRTKGALPGLAELEHLERRAVPASVETFQF